VSTAEVLAEAGFSPQQIRKDGETGVAHDDAPNELEAAP
jgi:hypothetical protein